ncbi:MAG: ribonuclease HII [Clostridia bacterium]|nr:ribonuclease HII [Clostridia bacterium]
MLTWDYDQSYRRTYGVVAGTDEAGRGPLAGPVVAAAVILPDGFYLEGLDDSKKLTEKKREKLFDEIVRSAVSYGIGEASPEEIDRENILNASLLAMRRAVALLTPSPAFVLVDGNVEKGFPYPVRAVVGGDGISPSIAAASVLAKVTRDRQMAEMDRQYPAYGFAKHKGYPTKDHMLAVYRYGPAPVHRKSFLSFLETKREMLEKMSRELDQES